MASSAAGLALGVGALAALHRLVIGRMVGRDGPGPALERRDPKARISSKVRSRRLAQAVPAEEQDVEDPELDGVDHTSFTRQRGAARFEEVAQVR